MFGMRSKLLAVSLAFVLGLSLLFAVGAQARGGHGGGHGYGGFHGGGHLGGGGHWVGATPVFTVTAAIGITAAIWDLGM